MTEEFLVCYKEYSTCLCNVTLHCGEMMLNCKTESNSNSTSWFQIAFSTQCNFTERFLHSALRKPETEYLAITVRMVFFLGYSVLLSANSRPNEAFKFYSPAQTEIEIL